MTAAVVALATTCVVLAGVLFLVVRSGVSERREWAAERRSLVDRALARHTGEVIALDRGARPSAGPQPPPIDRPVAVGL